MAGNTIGKQKEFDPLLSRKMPNYRQAYSDRTAWIMACVSQLAYSRFNPFDPKGRAKFIKKSLDLVISKEQSQKALKLIETLHYNHEEEKEALKSQLKALNANLVWTGDNEGTQCILVKFDSFCVLAFRGTEATSLKDIKSDANAIKTVCDSGGHIHSGFNNAYNVIEEQIHEALNKYLKTEGEEKMPLFITGHSLGGALATIAAKKLQKDFNIAACYTFGAPRVGNDIWLHEMKSPIYRVVNAADSVTMLPPGEIIYLIRLAIIWIPLCKPFAQWLYDTFGGYMHAGDMRYLTHVSKNHNDAKLLHSVSIIYRVKMLFKRGFLAKKFLDDHSINEYRKKLFAIACHKNP